MYGSLHLQQVPPPSLHTHTPQEDLEALKLLAAGSLHDNHTMWFSHYPSATITGNHHALRSLMSHSVAHVCGHLHTLAHLAPHMYGRHPGGHLELELGDFRDYRRWVEALIGP